MLVQPIHPQVVDLLKEWAENVYPFKNTGIDFVVLCEVTVLRRPVKH